MQDLTPPALRFLAGLAVIATTVGGDLTVLGLCLTALSAVSWGIGNVARAGGGAPRSPTRKTSA